MNATYMKCVDNHVYFKGSLSETYEPDLIIGKVYRVAPPLPNDNPMMIRIFDGSYGQPGSEIGYLYPRDYFEPIDLLQINGHADKSVSVHLPEVLAGILHAEAIMAETSVSALLRRWIVERLALPEAVKQ
jgi:hypothetical protein